MFDLKLLDYGDGYLVYFKGVYKGRDEQLDVTDMMGYAARAGGFDIIEMPSDWDGDVLDSLTDYGWINV